MDEDIVIPIAGMLMVIIISVGVPLVIALGKRWNMQAQQPKVPPEVTERLARMEQALDAVAIEVERIAEGQRFTTKLLSERAREGALLPGQRREET